MSTIDELFAPKFLNGGPLTEEIQAEMAAVLGCDSLRYLPVSSIANAISLSEDQLCRACITGDYPTPHGQQLYNIALSNVGNLAKNQGRTYEKVVASAASDIV